MKDLSIEEKAKLYDETIERAKKVLLDCTPEEQKVVEYIHPELEETEDEKIRKTLIRFFKDQYSNETKMYDGTVTVGKTLDWLEKQGEQNPNPYSGTSFVYNNHTWGMCARDGGVDILCDSKLIKHICEQKPIERKEFTNIPFGAFDSELIEESITIPDGCVATIEGNKIHIKRKYKTATEAIKEEKVDKANKVEPKFHEGEWDSEKKELKKI